MAEKLIKRGEIYWVDLPDSKGRELKEIYLKQNYIKKRSLYRIIRDQLLSFYHKILNLYCILMHFKINLHLLFSGTEKVEEIAVFFPNKAC